MKCDLKDGGGKYDGETSEDVSCSFAYFSFGGLKSLSS